MDILAFILTTTTCIANLKKINNKTRDYLKLEISELYGNKCLHHRV